MKDSESFTPVPSLRLWETHFRKPTSVLLAHGSGESASWGLLDCISDDGSNAVQAHLGSQIRKEAVGIWLSSGRLSDWSNRRSASLASLHHPNRRTSEYRLFCADCGLSAVSALVCVQTVPRKGGDLRVHGAGRGGMANDRGIVSPPSAVRADAKAEYRQEASRCPPANGSGHRDRSEIFAEPRQSPSAWRASYNSEHGLRLEFFRG